MKAKYIQETNFTYQFIFFLICVTTAFTFKQEYTNKNSVYWLYQRDGKTYKMLHKSASIEGVKVDSKKPKLTFKIILTEKEYINLKSKFPLQVVWNKYSIAKLSVFTTKKIEYKDLLVFKNKKNNQYYYIIACTLEDIMQGTWQVVISDVNNNTLEFAGKEHFDVIVL